MREANQETNTARSVSPMGIQDEDGALRWNFEEIDMEAGGVLLDEEAGFRSICPINMSQGGVIDKKMEKEAKTKKKTENAADTRVIDTLVTYNKPERQFDAERDLQNSMWMDR